MTFTTDPTHSERRRFLLQQIQYQYRQIIDHVGKTPGDRIEIPTVILPPLRYKFKYLSIDKLYCEMNHGLGYLLLGGLSAERMESLLSALNQMTEPRE